MDITRKIREELLADYGQIINGLCTPDEFVNMVMEDIIVNTAQCINLDYHDVTCVLRYASVADAVRLQQPPKQGVYIQNGKKFVVK